MKVVIFAQELLSVVLTPFILWYSLPPCAPAIVDFFREFSVHVDGLDYVCSFAVFDFKRHGNVKVATTVSSIHNERGALIKLSYSMVSRRRRTRTVSCPKRVRWRNHSSISRYDLALIYFQSLTVTGCLQAANPQWNPTDPSGSLYLSKLADYGVAHPPAMGRRSHSHNRFDGSEGGVNRMQDYDRALQQSTARAAARRRSATTSRTLSQDTVKSADQTPVQSVSISTVRDQDRALDGGVGSELGDSYIDEISMRKAGKTFLPVSSEHQDDDELRDAGVLGLLTQIYDQGRAVL